MTNRRRPGSERATQWKPSAADNSFNEGFWVERLRDDLDELYEDRGKEVDPRLQRQRTKIALALLNAALSKHPHFANSKLQYDIITLVYALDDIDANKQNLFLQPPPIKKPPHSLRTRNRRRLVGAMAVSLIAAGMSRSEAFAFVADELTSAGIGALRPKIGDLQGFSPNTVKDWVTHLEGGTASEADKAELAKARRNSAGISDTKRWVRIQIRSPELQWLFHELIRSRF